MLCSFVMEFLLRAVHHLHYYYYYYYCYYSFSYYCWCNFATVRVYQMPLGFSVQA